MEILEAKDIHCEKRMNRMIQEVLIEYGVTLVKWNPNVINQAIDLDRDLGGCSY
jgi:hypothetical protein